MIRGPGVTANKTSQVKMSFLEYSAVTIIASFKRSDTGGEMPKRNGGSYRKKSVDRVE